MLRILTLVLLISLSMIPPPLLAQAQSTPLAARALSELQQLNLSPLQKQQLLSIVLDARSRQLAISADQQALFDQAQPALQTGQADRLELSARQQAITDQRIAAARMTRDELLAFYLRLTPAQQGEVQGWLATLITRIDALRTLAAIFQPWLALP